MKTKVLLLTVVALLVAQDAFAYGRRGGGNGYGGYGYGGYGAGTTVAGSYLAGTAALTQAAGSFNYNTSRAAVNYQQAYQHYIENRKLAVQTYFDLRRMNASYRAEQEMQHPHATPDELVAFNQARMPEPLSANVFDPGHGLLDWPPLLARPEFAENRAKIEGLYGEWAADPHGSGLGTQNCRDIDQAVSDMGDKLHSEIKQFKPDEYIAASKFLKSLAFQARSSSGNTVAAK
ncbi:MAG TPA: hypothetical protein VHC22_33525 [Pirellulales bacterium]|nr:hypothetical protein [Pirellulales bacterium]